jgi:hypothetical protein
MEGAPKGSITCIQRKRNIASHLEVTQLVHVVLHPCTMRHAIRNACRTLLLWESEPANSSMKVACSSYDNQDTRTSDIEHLAILSSTVLTGYSRCKATEMSSQQMAHNGHLLELRPLQPIPLYQLRNHLSSVTNKNVKSVMRLGGLVRRMSEKCRLRFERLVGGPEGVAMCERRLEGPAGLREGRRESQCPREGWRDRKV